MQSSFSQYEINSEWRRHAINYFIRRKSLDKSQRDRYSEGIYCDNDVEYEAALIKWISFLKDEERYIFYNTIIDLSFGQSKRTLEILDKYKGNFNELQMPLLRDVVINYVMPFHKSQGRLGVSYRIDLKISNPLLEGIHDKLVSDRDQIFAHADLGIRSPRASALGIKVAGLSNMWNEYHTILPKIGDLIDCWNETLNDYKIVEKLSDFYKYFSKHNQTYGIEEKSPEKLNKMYELEINKIVV